MWRDSVGSPADRRPPRRLTLTHCRPVAAPCNQTAGDDNHWPPRLIRRPKCRTAGGSKEHNEDQGECERCSRRQTRARRQGCDTERRASPREGFSPVLSARRDRPPDRSCCLIAPTLRGRPVVWLREGLAEGLEVLLPPALGRGSVPHDLAAAHCQSAAAPPCTARAPPICAPSSWC